MAKPTTLRREHRPRTGGTHEIIQLFADEGYYIIDGKPFAHPAHITLRQDLREAPPSREKIERFREMTAQARLHGAGIGGMGIYETVKVVKDADASPGVYRAFTHDGYARTQAAQELEADRVQMVAEGVDSELAFPTPYLVPIMEVVPASEVESLYSQDILNSENELPNPIEQSRLFHRLIRAGQTVEAIARRRSYGVRYVKDTLKLVSFEPDVQRMMEKRADTKSSAEKINRVKSPKRRETLIDEALAGASHKKLTPKIEAAIEEERKEEGKQPAAPRANEPTPSERRDAILGDLRQARSVIAMQRGKLGETRRRVWNAIERDGSFSAAFCGAILDEQAGIAEQIAAMRRDLDAIEEGVKKIVWDANAEELAGERAA